MRRNTQVRRYNANGLVGLIDRARPGRTPMLNTDRMSELVEIVEAGPDPETDGVVRWRRINLCAAIEQRFGTCMAERTMSSILRRLGLAKLSARPCTRRISSKSSWPNTARALSPIEPLLHSGGSENEIV